MKKLILNQEQIYALVKNNQYSPSPNEIHCRCIDGRYDKKLKTKNKIIPLPALTIPGGDIGQIAIFLGASHNFGFEINQDKFLKAYEDFLSGWQNFHYHSDTHHSASSLAAGCGYYSLIKNNPEKFFLEKRDLEILKDLLKIAGSKSQQEILLGHHNEAAVVLVKGKVGIFPRFFLTIKDKGGEKEIETSIFVFNQTLFNQRQKILAKRMIEGQVVKLFKGLDEEYLAFTLIETAEIHFFETINQLGQGLPIYQVVFGEDFKFKIEELEKIIKTS